MVTILEDSHWEDLFNWVEAQPAREAVRVTESLKCGSPASSNYSGGSSPPTASGAALQGETRRSTGPVTVQRQFRALTEIEMEPLKQRPNDNTSLWPKPNRHTGSWPSHNINEITLFLADALGYLTGTAPISDDELAKYTWNEKLPFKVPVKVL
ncbi:hypothetical protein PG996_006825 [Apiospora saccharicola]|uniref:Uncharacterized protein n=1 Tax=Apiospora saccharicola TaxID=335842 RepID=A0ABR1VCQ3_9PEZI